MPAQKLADRNAFTIDTGNLSKHIELMLKRHVNSSSELTAAFAKFAKDRDVNQNQLDFSSDPIALSSGDLGEFRKSSDIKTTLKLFLLTFSPEYAATAVRMALEHLELSSLFQVILQFPEAQDEMDDPTWLAAVLGVWQPLEKLVDAGKILYLGVSDIELERLRMLCEAANEPPKIEHYSIDGCCTVPQELVEYAKAHDIQILTHPDSRSFELGDEFMAEGQKLLGDALLPFGPAWVARYTIWLNSRSVMASKGYLVHFERK
ncbi:unnamed protein product, partial [Mesorhabditis spiculigera]